MGLIITMLASQSLVPSGLVLKIQSSRYQLQMLPNHVFFADDPVQSNPLALFRDANAENNLG